MDTFDSACVLPHLIPLPVPPSPRKYHPDFGVYYSLLKTTSSYIYMITDYIYISVIAGRNTTSKVSDLKHQPLVMSHDSVGQEFRQDSAG